MYRARTVLAAIGLMLVCSSAAAGQGTGTPTTIPEMWNAWCARCHAKDGSGKVTEPTVTVEPMDFTDCTVTTPEGDSDWEAVIARGGPVVGLSSQMPAFGDFLKPDQITEFVGFIKKFCTDRGWPSGNLNLPRPLFAEKAFPENEFLLVPMASHRKGQPAEFEFEAVYERRIGKRGQIEAVLPFASVDAGGGRNSGVSDVELGFKYALNPSWTNHLAALGFDVVLPSGREARGLGGGSVVFEPYLSTATVIGSQTYVQAQLKLELPRHAPWRDRTTVYNIYLGRDAVLLPSTFTFGVELNGENREVALTPQIRKGLSRSGALAGAFGVRIPINEREEQGVKWVGYLLWEYLEPVRSRR
jgi:hypothetical protein